MPPSLHPRNFPHIVEEIVQHLDYEDLLSARLVSPAMVPMVDKLLAGDPGEISLQIWKIRGSIAFISEKGCLPYFHRSSDTTWQYAAMRRTGKLRILPEVGPSKRLNDLLRHLPPNAQVTVEHGRNAAANYHFPALSSVNVISDPSCDCKDLASRSAASAFQHTAQHVTLTFKDKYHSAPGRCNVVSSLLGPSVETLSIEAPNFHTLKLAMDPLNANGRREALHTHVHIESAQPPPAGDRYTTRLQFAQWWLRRLQLKPGQLSIYG